MEDDSSCCSLNDDLQPVQNWLKCLKDLLNQFAIEDDSTPRKRIPEIKTDFLGHLKRIEKRLGTFSREAPKIEYFLEISWAFLQLHCFSDPLLEQKNVENKAAIAQLMDRLKEFDLLKTEKYLVDFAKEHLATILVVWGAQAIIEILDYSKTGDLIELKRLSVDDLEILISVINCLGNWARYMGGYQINKCQNICEILVKVIEKSYWPCAEREDGHMSDIEKRVAESVAKTLKYIVTQKESQNYPKSAFTLIKLFFDTLSLITKAECKENNKNQAIVVNINELIASACEHHVGLILTGITRTDPEHAEFSKLLIAEIFKVTTKISIYPADESCSEVIVHFWLILAHKVNHDLNWEEKQKCLQEIKALYIQLTYILLEKAQHPDDNVAKTLTEQNLKDLRNYRSALEFPLWAFYDMLKSAMLQILSNFLDKGIAEFKANPISWNKLEVSIFGFGTIAEYADPPIESEKIRKLMRILTELPYGDVNGKLSKTAFNAVESLRYWFRENLSYIPDAVQILVKGLKSSAASSAVWGVSELCSECGMLIKPFTKLLLDAYNESLSSGKMPLYDSDYRAIGTLISMLPAEMIPTYLDLFVNFYSEKLQMICQVGEKTPEDNSTTILGLKKLLYLFNSVNAYVKVYGAKQEVDICLQSVFLQCQAAMPLFRQIAEFWKDDQFVIYEVFSVLSGVFNALKMNFKPMLEDFCSFFISIYQREPFSMALLISRECLQVFGLDEESKQLMQQFFSQIVFYTFKFFEETPENEFSKINEMAGEFRNWITYLIEHFFEFLLDINVNYNKIIPYVFKVLALSEYSEVDATVRFFGNLILKSRNQPNMTLVVLDHGEAIVRTAILSIACRNTSRGDVEKFADLLQALKNDYLTELKNWLKMLDMPNFPTPVISEEDKKKFAAQIIKPNSNKYHIRMYARGFAANCREVEQV